MKVFVLVVLATLWGDATWACSCSPPGPPLEALSNAKSVFVGEVVARRDSFAVDSAQTAKFGEVAGSNWGSFLTVRVLKWWKWNGQRLADDSSATAIQNARVDTLVTVLTSGDGASCGVGFKVGERYVIYGLELWGRFQPWQGRVTAGVSLCSRTRALLYGWEDVLALGVGEKDLVWMKELLKYHSLPENWTDTRRGRR